MLFSLFWRQRPQQFGLTRTIVLSVFHKRWDLNVFNLCAMKNLADLIVTRTQWKGFCGWGPIGYVSHFQLSLFSLRKNDSGCKLPFNKRKFPTWKRNNLSHKIHHTCSIHHVYVWSKQLSYTIIWKRGSLWNLSGLFNSCLPQAALSNEGEKTGYFWSVYQSIELSLEHKCIF